MYTEWLLQITTSSVYKLITYKPKILILFSKILQRYGITKNTNFLVIAVLNEHNTHNFIPRYYVQVNLLSISHFSLIILVWKEYVIINVLDKKSLHLLEEENIVNTYFNA
jgi:hypothetical protein